MLPQLSFAAKRQQCETNVKHASEMHHTNVPQALLQQSESNAKTPQTWYAHKTPKIHQTILPQSNAINALCSLFNAINAFIALINAINATSPACPETEAEAHFRELISGSMAFLGFGTLATLRADKWAGRLAGGQAGGRRAGMQWAGGGRAGGGSASDDPW